MVVIARPMPWQPAIPAWLRPWLRTKIYLGGTIVLGLIFLGLFGPALAPYNPNEQQLREALRVPQWFGGPYFLGTDNLGRDILSRLLHGARVSLIIAFTVVLISGAIGVTLGAVSGYFGGRVDFLIQKLVEVIWAFPSLLLAIAILAYLGQGLQNLILALVAQRWIQYCRVVRGETLSLRHREFVTAARVVGASHARIIVRHIIPNIIPSSLVIGTFAMATAIIAEASLSFLGLGVPPEIPTWGTMLGDGRNYISTAPWLTIFPGLAIFTVVLGINLLGDGLRDVLDPRRTKVVAEL
ncbi:MAG TPA: ABC transporter permease [Chloroflexota bacterium]|nr:ABC transporter permease [Chloroflexota bacterium]HZU07411.1 ABC transporter permease [Chloroflexota bacterium]